jgi:hypothetical protein
MGAEELGEARGVVEWLEVEIGVNEWRSWTGEVEFWEIEGEDGTVGAGKTGEEINIVEGGDNNRLWELLEERTLLAELVKIDCIVAGKLPSSKITFQDI